MLRAAIIHQFGIMIILNLILFFSCSFVKAEENNETDNGKPLEDIKTFSVEELSRHRSKTPAPIMNNLKFNENTSRLTDQSTSSTSYNTRAVNNRRQRRRRRNNNHQFLGPVRNMFGGRPTHRRQRPYKRLPQTTPSHYRVGVYTPTEVRAY